MTDSVSYWMDRLDRPIRPGPSGDTDFDVCIIGAGYTGLWSAYYLAFADPGLRVAVIDSHFVGFGASGRNGGWASAKVAGLDRMLADPKTRDGAARTYRQMISTLDEFERVLQSEAIDCDWARGGTIVTATRPAHVARLKASLELKHSAGFGDHDGRWLEPDEARRRLNTSRNHGASYTPHCAALDPARLVLGLAAAVERRGVRIFEGTPGVPVAGGVETPGGRIRADRVVLATEAYGVRLPGRRRRAIPVYSLMVVTEPLPEAAWEEIGLAQRETFSDGRHMIIYGQRTADGRIAFGGRGAPYHYGSRIEPGFDRNAATFEFLRMTLADLFPALGGVRYEGEWGGPLAIPRDWRPSISAEGSLVAVGNYVGQGVATANLMGRTVSDLITGADSDLLSLPWVGHRARRWEPEPLRWVGVNLGRRLTESIDHSEEGGRRARIRQAILDRLPVG